MKKVYDTLSENDQNNNDDLDEKFYKYKKCFDSADYLYKHFMIKKDNYDLIIDKINEQLKDDSMFITRPFKNVDSVGKNLYHFLLSLKTRIKY